MNAARILAWQAARCAANEAAFGFELAAVKGEAADLLGDLDGTNAARRAAAAAALRRAHEELRGMMRLIGGVSRLTGGDSRRRGGK